MKKSVFFFAFTFLSLQTFALEIPVGKYELVGQECTSGKPAGPLVPSEMMESNMTAVLDFSATNFKLDANIHYKMVGAMGQGALENYAQAIAELEKKPSTPENDQELNYMKQMYAEIQEMVAGRNCNLKMDIAYGLDGNKMSATINTAESNCKEFITEEMVGTKKVQFVKVEGDLLKLETAPESPDAKSEQCDSFNGERLIEIYKKMN